jgi:phospholipid/cholesterol/gamma-HCH transport system substrate-binding protein
VFGTSAVQSWWMPSARAVAWARLRVTVAAVAAAAILGVVVYLLTGGTLLVEKATIYLFIDDATGVDPGTAVRVNGIGVGKVDDVRLSGSNQPNRIIRITLKVERDHLADIPADSTAQISSDGVTGDKYVDVTQGRTAARIQPGSEIIFKPAPELTKTLDLQQFTKQMRSMDATLTDIEQGKGFVGQFVVGTDMYNQTLKALADIDRSFRKAVSVTGSAGHIVRTDELYRQIRDPLIELDDRLARMQTGQGQMGQLLREDREYDQLRDQAANLRKAIGDFRARPFFTADDLYNSWTKELGSLIGQVDRINRSSAFSNSADYENLSGTLREWRASIHEFRTSPAKFMRLKLF